jgi:hypothetical protein
MNAEAQFWMQAVSRGLPWFRLFRRPIPVQQLDQEMAGTLLESEWLELKAIMEPCDQIWPFRFDVRSDLGMRQGYIVLRSGEPLGGLVTRSS